MEDVARFEFLLVIVSAVLVLALAAKALRLPPSAAFISGGLVIALLPGIPRIAIDPGLILVIFLPPLLMSGAYFTVWASFRQYLVGIVQLAVGAVVFSTLFIGVATHLFAPALPWSVCFALGAILAPPDAVAAKSVLEHVRLPERLSTLLEGESLLNDATSLVVYRVAIAAFLTGSFSAMHAVAMFGVLATGGVVLGLAMGWVALLILRRINDTVIVICLTLLSPWVAYIIGEHVHVSGVMATVTMGLIFGWHQHEIFSANTRLRADAFWGVLTFLLEALIFVIIGLSLRSVFRIDHDIFPSAVGLMEGVIGVVLATVMARFLWTFGAAAVGLLRPGRGGEAKGGVWGEATVLGWAGMRGVVSLAIALSTPETMPGRSFILLATFAVILFTVIGQGGTLAMVIRWSGLGSDDDGQHHLSEHAAWARLAAAQRQAVERLAINGAGEVIHPRLLEQYRYREQAAQRFSQTPEILSGDRDAHYAAVMATIAAGREEILKLHRAGQIHDSVLRRLEFDLDVQQLAVENR